MTPTTDDKPRCAGTDCGAVLLPGFDPPGDLCRNCAPKATRRAEMKRR